MRPLTIAVLVGCLVAVGSPSAAAPPDAPDPPKPPKPPKPELVLVTETQREALRQQAVKVVVDSKRGDEARVRATLVVAGYPEDYSFRLGPESKRLRDGEARVRLALSARQREVLAFAAQACDGATLDIAATAAGRTADLHQRLRKDC